MTPEESSAAAPPRVSVVIVTHNRCQPLHELLSSLGGGSAPDFTMQIVVVDNGSTDGTPSTVDSEFPGVRMIRLPKNFGLTKALNIGIRAAEGTYMLLLHDDVVLSAGDVTKLADYLEDHPESGSVSPLLVRASGEPGPQVRPLPTPAQPDPPYEPANGSSAESTVGAAVMYRAFFLRAIRQIDERYGNFGPDFELAWQIRKGGKAITILHEVKAKHLALTSPVSASVLAGDRAAGTAAFLASHVGFLPGLLYRLSKGLAALLTFRFSVVAGAFTGQKIDGTS